MLDWEGFRNRKTTFIGKEVAIALSDYSDCLNFQSLVLFNSLPRPEQKAYTWLTKNLHGINWVSGDYLYSNLNQIIQSFFLRKLNASFYAKKKNKTELLSKYLGRKLRILMNWVARKLKTYISRFIQFAIDLYIITTPGIDAP